MNKKIEYFLNAIFYFLYLEEVWTNKIIDGITNGFATFMIRILHSGGIHLYKSKVNSNRKIKECIYGASSSLSACMANWLFASFYSCYSSFVSWICIGIANCKYDIDKNSIGLLFFIVPCIICYIPAYRAVFAKDNYLKYFRQFTKNSKQWHHRWKRVTIAFCIGAIVTMVAGFLCMTFITSFRTQPTAP